VKTKKGKGGQERKGKGKEGTNLRGRELSVGGRQGAEGKMQVASEPRLARQSKGGKGWAGKTPEKGELS